MKVLRSSISFIFSLLVIISVVNTSVSAAVNAEFLQKYFSDNNLFYKQDKRNREIHFFWTSGRKFKDVRKFTDPSDRKYLLKNKFVYFGGSKGLASTFSEALTAMLSAAQANYKNRIKVKLVVDQLTYKTNVKFLKKLSKKFKESFSVVYIDKFKKDLASKLPNKLWENKAKYIFANADQGNPAIASDIYRLIHPIVRSEDVQKNTVFTYSDVDSFVKLIGNGSNYIAVRNILDQMLLSKRVLDNEDDNDDMSISNAKGPNRISSEVEFDGFVGEYKEQKFGILFQGGANDIIVTFINDTKAFKKFVKFVISEVFDGDKSGIIKSYHFKYLHAISPKDNASKKLFGVIRRLHNSILTKQRDILFAGHFFPIVWLTGPGFLSGLSRSPNSHFNPNNISEGLSYETVSEGSWFGIFHLLRNIDIKGSLGFVKSKKKSKTVKTIEESIKEYAVKLEAVSYIYKLFGENHPMYKTGIEILKKENPLTSDKFKEYVMKKANKKPGNKDYIIQFVKEQRDKDHLTTMDILIRELKKLGISYDFEKVVFDSK